MLSYWIYLLAVLVLVASFFVPGGPTGAGWTLYPPQAILSGTPGYEWGIILMLVSLILFIIGFTMGGLNYVVTVLQGAHPRHDADAHAAHGLGHLHRDGHGAPRLPGPVRRRRHDAARPAPRHELLHAVARLDMGEQLKYGGGTPILFQHLFWFFGHPEVYIVALPAFGIVSDLISTHARRNIFGYRMMVWAIVAIGALSFVVWAHHMYVSGMNPYFGFFFATTTLIIAIPTAIKVYNWVLTLWRGDIHLTLPMLFALAFIVTFVNGGLTGLFLGNVVVDVPLSDTMFVVAHFHMVMGVAPILVIFGAIYHWYPKMTGRMLDEALGKIHFWVTFVGAYAIFFPMHYVGLLGVPRRYHDIGDVNFMPPSAHDLNAFITIAALIVGAAQLVFLFNLFWSLQHGKDAGGNPWRATTLEWQTPETPPAHGNFGKELPIVYRWAYDYSVPGADEDFIPQNQPTGSRSAPARGSERDRHDHLPRRASRDRRSLWLAQHGGLMTKPWLEEGVPADIPGAAPDLPPRRLGSGSFSRSSARSLRSSISAYFMRMQLPDWWSPPVPPVLWVKHRHHRDQLALPAMSAKGCAHRGDLDGVKRGIAAGGASAIAFLIGQAIAWRISRRQAIFSPPIPANSFFYLITAVHGLHVLGGLVALGGPPTGRGAVATWASCASASIYARPIGISCCSSGLSCSP